MMRRTAKIMGIIIMLLGISGLGLFVYHSVKPCEFSGPDSCWDPRSPKERRRHNQATVAIFGGLVVLGGGTVVFSREKVRKMDKNG